jgi:hypothetical protein
MENMTKITIEIDNPESVTHDISDLLCWWQGFSTGMNHRDDDFNPVAGHGIEAIRKLNIKIKDKINEK